MDALRPEQQVLRAAIEQQVEFLNWAKKNQVGTQEIESELLRVSRRYMRLKRKIEDEQPNQDT